MTTTDTRYTKFDIGLYFDGVRGVYIGEAIQRMAWSHDLASIPTDIGFIPCDHTECVSISSAEYHSEDDHGQWYDDATTEAEDFLNTLTDDDVAFGPSEQGDWGLWHLCDDDLDCDFCSTL